MNNDNSHVDSNFMKIKKIVIAIFPIFIMVVIVIMIFIKNKDMRNMMGSVVGCKQVCDKGYLLDKTTSICYKETEKKRSYVDANLLGDIDNNGTITSNDFNILRSNISNNLNNEYNYLYDINQDRIINDKDLTELASIISLNVTSGGEPSSIYVCPGENKIYNQTINDYKEYIVINYELENTQCLKKTIIRSEKKSKYDCH